MPLTFFSNTNSGGSSVPFSRIAEPQELSFLLNLEQAELLRIKRYDELWRFYYGKHWSFTREDGEPLVTVNYFRKFIDKHAEFLLSKGFEISVPDALEEVTKPYLEEVWKYNNREALSWDIAVTGGTSGDAFVLVTDEEPSELQKTIFPFSEGKTRINLLASEQCFPSWDPLNVDVMTSIRIETLFYDNSHKQELAPDPNSAGHTPAIKRFSQTITARQIVTQVHGETPVIKPNSLGEIPVVHIKNLSAPKEFYGLSDGQDLVDLNRELNEKSTDISDTINYHSSPITVITGAKTKSLQRGPKMIWSGLPAEAKVYNLELESDLGAATQYRDSIKKSMHEIGDIPEGILGETQPISNTSGVALHIQYQPILGRARRKRATYGPGFEKINYFILRIGALTGRLRLYFDCCAGCGGRILEHDDTTGKTEFVWNEANNRYEQKPLRVKKCYAVDSQTLDFKDPADVRLKIWKEYGFGGEIREVTLDEAKAIAAGKVSYWDYAVEDRAAIKKWKTDVAKIEQENLNLEPVDTGKVDANGNPVVEQPQPKPIPPRPMPKVEQLPLGDVQVPEEPINLSYTEDLRHPKTGEVVQVVERKRFVVPTGCTFPRYQNPFENSVSFNEVLPKDEAIQAALFKVYQDSQWVDPEWVQKRIPAIAKDAAEINKRNKVRATSGLPKPYGAGMTPAQTPVTDLTPHEQPPDAVPGKGGNPTSPLNDGRN